MGGASGTALAQALQCNTPLQDFWLCCVGISMSDVIGTVLAQTVALEHHEIKVDNMIEIFSGLNKSTEETGEMDISKARLFKLVAENNNTLTELVTRMRLLGRSDTAWQYAQYDAVWNGLRKDFELEDRFDHLDYKLNLIQTQVKFYLEILQNRKSGGPVLSQRMPVASSGAIPGREMSGSWKT